MSSPPDSPLAAPLQTLQSFIVGMMWSLVMMMKNNEKNEKILSRSSTKRVFANVHIAQIMEKVKSISHQINILYGVLNQICHFLEPQTLALVSYLSHVSRCFQEWEEAMLTEASRFCWFERPCPDLGWFFLSTVIADPHSLINLPLHGSRSQSEASTPGVDQSGLSSRSL